MTDALLLLAGLLLLTVAADRFVLGAARLSTALRVSPVLVGAIVIGFGTSAPELVVTITATLQGSQDLAFGNVVGSNTANVLIVLGVAAMLRPLPVSIPTLRREVPLMLAAVTLLAVVTANGRVVAWEALTLLAAAAVVIAIIVRSSLQDRDSDAVMAAEIAEWTHSEEAPPAVPPAVVITVLGLLGTLLGAQLLVAGATGIAVALGISQAVIGLTVVAVGTSLPELVTAAAAARRDEGDLVVGNVLGSNVFNSLLVAGGAGLLDTIDLDPAFDIGLVVMLVACTAAGVLMYTRRRVQRWEGAVLLGGYVAVVALTV